MKFHSYNIYSNCHNLVILIVCVALSAPVTAQVQKFNNKLSPAVSLKINSAQAGTKNLFRIMLSGQELPVVLNYKALKAKQIVVYDKFSFYMISATTDQLINLVLPLPAVLFVDDGARIPKEEVLVNNLDLSTNRINMVHRKFPQLNGVGLTVSVKENRPDTTDIDFAGRYLTTNLTSSITSSHATNMATMIAGGGNSWYLGKGTAWASIMSSSNFANLLPDPLPVLQQYNISVQNHSYGVGIENFYGADAAIYDANMIADPVLLNVFSSGNSGTLTSTTGTYAGITGFANLTGSFKMAKNIITVGATDSFGNVAILSSKGPAFDGRIKPELVAFGIDGSSGAAALVSGVSLMLQQQYKQMNGPMPANVLIKAILLNSADDRGNTAVDFSNGFGSLNALNAVRAIQMGRHRSGAVSNGSTQSFGLSIPAGIKKIKITLAWADPAAATNAAKALINDLDLELLNTGTNETWKPWVLNSFPHIDSLKQLATRKRDSINNVEQVTIENPAAGNYQVLVKGYAVNTASQNFHFAYQLDSSDIFEWQFPAAPDPVFAASVNTLRWNSSYAATTGKLDYSIDNGISWLLADAAVDLTKSYYNWNAPAAFTTSLLKMTIGANQFISDTFVIAARTTTG
ncbi:MAG: S8 family serine peptidase, partial [Ferruginibacter sp.]